jgi:TatD DNase family protein
MLIDSHVNLHAPQFDEDRDEVIARAREAGVGLMVEISDKLSTFEATHGLAMAHDDIWCTVGVHPHEAKDYADLTAGRLAELAGRDRVVGIGECGLDFHYDLSPRDTQAAVFRQHIEAARLTGLPLVVHTREADDVMTTILSEEQAAAPFKFLMHCYTSGPELAEKAAELGGWFSVSGIATFKAAGDVREAIRAMPADRIIIETDCPYLAPVPHRGRRNEPAYVGHVLDVLADIRGWTRAEAEARTTDAFFALFDRIPGPEGA